MFVGGSHALRFRRAKLLPPFEVNGGEEARTL
jgi:hypothetical protein